MHHLLSSSTRSSAKFRMTMPLLAQAVPPSTGSATPVMKYASSEARNSAALATSQAVPICCRSGTWELRSATTSLAGRAPGRPGARPPSACPSARAGSRWPRTRSGVVDRDLLGLGDHRGLGRLVADRTGSCDQRRDRGDVDDRRPPPCARIIGMACLQASTMPRRFTAMIAVEGGLDLVDRAASPPAMLMPTLLCRTSMRPQRQGRGDGRPGRLDRDVRPDRHCPRRRRRRSARSSPPPRPGRGRRPAPWRPRGPAAARSHARCRWRRPGRPAPTTIAVFPASRIVSSIASPSPRLRGEGRGEGQQRAAAPVPAPHPNTLPVKNGERGSRLTISASTTESTLTALVHEHGVEIDLGNRVGVIGGEMREPRHQLDEPVDVGSR